MASELPRHRDQRARNRVIHQACEQLTGTRAPWHVLGDAGNDAGQQLVDDLDGRELDRRVGQDVLGRDQQVVPDELVCVLVGPHAAVLLHQSALLRDPVGLGVHESAVHVPQNRRRECPGHVALSVM